MRRNRDDLRAKQIERSVDYVQIDQRNSTRRARLENIRKLPPQESRGFLPRRRSGRAFLFQVERTDVVQAQDVIGMPVRVDDGIQMVDLRAQGLSSENRASCRSPHCVRPYDSSTEGRVRLSCGSVDSHTAQWHPSVGTPIDVPDPKNR